MVFYKKAKGVIMTALVLGGAGNYFQNKTVPGASTAWSIIAGSQNGVVLYYDPDGNIATDHVNVDGTEIGLKRYEPVDNTIPSY